MQLFASPEKDHQLESRMRENRPSGLEGGGGGQYPPLPTPIQGALHALATAPRTFPPRARLFAP